MGLWRDTLLLDANLALLTSQLQNMSKNGLDKAVEGPDIERIQRQKSAWGKHILVGVSQIFFLMAKTYTPRPQCQFILDTDHHTPLIMATIANRAKRAAKQLATRTPSNLHLRKCHVRGCVASL